MASPGSIAEPAPLSRPGRRLLLGAILALAASVRFWGIDFGLPHPECRPDETKVATIALSFFTSPDYNPHFFNYPTLHMYALHVVYQGAYLLGRLTGAFGRPEFLALWSSDVTLFLLISRSFSALLGTLTALVAYATGAQLVGPRAGLLGAFFVSLSFLAVRESHFGVTDTAMTLLVLLSCHSLLKSHRTGRARDFLLAAALAGLAMGTKYNALLLAAPALAVLVAAHRREGRSLSFRDSARRLAVFAGTCVVVFLAVTPYVVLDHRQFVADLLFEADHLRTAHGPDFGRGWWWHLAFSLPQGVGAPLLASAALGVGLLFRRDPWSAAIFCAFPVAYYLAMGSGRTVFIRHVLPLVPFVALAAAVATAEAARWLARRWGAGKREAALTVGLALVIALPSARKVVAFDRLLARTDNRLIASSWAEASIPATATLFQSGYVGGHLFLPRHAGKWRFDNEKRRFLTEDGPTDGRPDWIVIQESPLRHYYSETPRWIERLLRREYELVKEWKAVDMDRADVVYDQQDGFYVPLDGFEAVARPGPNLYVYRRRAGPADRPFAKTGPEA
jgi:4-amino-4-deoxy-L-arabinose transferase-like glycosyltransferase